MMSFESLIAQGSGLIGSLLSGFVADVWSIPTAWMLVGIILATSSLAYLYLSFNSKRLNLLTCPSPGKVSGSDEESPNLRDILAICVGCDRARDDDPAEGEDHDIPPQAIKLRIHAASSHS